MVAHIQSISNKHRLMMEALVYDGLTQKEACAKYDFSEPRFSLIRKSPLWVMEEREMRAEYRLERKKAMESLVPKAMIALERNLTVAPPATQVSAAKAILDRGGMPANLVITDGEDAVGDSDALYDTLKSIQEEKQLVLAELGVDSVDDLIEAESKQVVDANS